MSGKQTNRKEWVKNAAIVFLAVMLVLTFFSNTIMNYSLPEVATQYIQSGSISAQIRGTGTVESGDPYNVKIKGTSKVESIEVNVGQKVQKGDVLMHLAYDESEALKTAQAELEAAKLAFELALLTSGADASVMQNAGNTLSTNTYKNQIIALKNTIALAEAEVETAQQTVDELTRWGSALTTQISITPSNNADTSKEQKAVSDADSALTKANAALTAAQDELNRINRDLDLELSVSPGDAVSIDKLQKDKTAAMRKVNDAQTAVDTAQRTYDNAKTALENKLASGDTSGTIANLEEQKRINDVNLFHAQNTLNDKNKVLAEAEEALNDYIKNTTDSINLSSQYQNVEKAQEKVEELQAQAGGSEVTAPVSGTITALNVSSGLDTPADGIVATMQPEGKGYSMSFSVTNDQARTVNVGEQATLVNYWRYDDLTVTLVKIMPDKSNPTENKLLVFDVEGENVIDGQTLNVSVGQRSANYDMLVPNSAVREDNNGKFILIVQVKNSPLGNRYVASRVDVEVLASDDTKSAISGAVNSYEYVITTSNLPVEAGDYVRLPEN